MFIDANRDFYHLAGPMLEVGSVIKKGNYGRILKIGGWNHGHAYREKSLELARKLVNPNLPSRLECIFCFSSSDTAIAFKNSEQGFGMHNLYRVRPLDINAPAFVSHHSHVNPLATPNPALWPESYWMRVGTETENDFPNAEVLILSDLRIEELIE